MAEQRYQAVLAVISDGLFDFAGRLEDWGVATDAALLVGPV